MAFSTKLRDILQKNGQDFKNKNFIPVIVDAYFQGGAECVGELKELLNNAGVDKKFFNDAIQKIITDLLRIAMA